MISTYEILYETWVSNFTLLFANSLSFYKHKIRNPLFKITDLKKQFEVPPYSQQVSRGHQVQIRCHPPKGRPTPKISWMQNGRLIDPNADKNFIVTGEGHLIVVAARLTDTANYTCVAENVASKRFSDPAAITVYGKQPHSDTFLDFCSKFSF